VRIALIEDDADLAQLMRVWMEAVGHECVWFGEGKPFLDGLAESAFDLIVLDWMLPDIMGDEVLARVRAELGWPIPILFVTQRDSEADIVYALEHGADDYMTKPVKPLEMLARISALGRRTKGQQQEEERQLSFGVYSVDLTSRSLTHRDQPVELTQKEFDLAVYFFRNRGQLLSRKQILEAVWGVKADINTRTVDTHVSRLRQKLGLAQEPDWRLSAVYQHGYRLEHLEAGSDPSGLQDSKP
jgi:DNA-binding response OmpR family regulator